MSDYDVILFPKIMKFLEIGKFDAGLCLSRKFLFSLKNAILKIVSSIVMSPLRRQYPYDTHLDVVTNDA